MSSDRARAVHEAPHGRAPSAKRIAVVEPARAEDRKVIREILRGPRGRAHPKLVAGTPDDPLEREADDLADAVMRRPMGAADAPLLESHRIEAVSGAPRGSDPVGRAVSPTARPAAPAAILRQGPSEPDPRWPPLGGGTVLAEDLRAEFEPRFGTSLGHVRIHTDSESAHLARDLGARAFTVGSDIGFAQGELAPWSHRGRALMAHELAHVVLGHHGINRKEGSNDSEGSTTKAGSVALAVANPPLALAIAEVELLGGALKGIWTGFASRLDADDHEQLVELLQGLPEHAPSFLAGVQIGQVMGLGEGLLNNLKFILYEIPAGVWHAVGKLSPGERLGLFAAFVSPIPGATAMALATIAAKELREHREGLAAFAKVIYEEIRTLVTDLEGQGDWLEELGKRVGEPLGRELGDTFRGEILYEPDYYWKGGMLGRISGLIAFEILLLVVAPEALLGKVGAATLPLVRRLAKALEGTKLWRRVEGLVAKSKALEQVASLRKAGGVVEEVAGTGKAAHAVGDAEKAVGQSVEAGKAVEGAVGTKAARRRAARS